MKNKAIKTNQSFIFSTISMIVIFIGVIGINLFFILSETFYSQIENFCDFPITLQIIIYFSIIFIFSGIIGCILTKNKRNILLIEFNIEFIFCFIGIICLSFSLARTSALWKIIIIYIGSLLTSIGFFCGIATIINLIKTRKG